MQAWRKTRQGMAGIDKARARVREKGGEEEEEEAGSKMERK